MLHKFKGTLYIMVIFVGRVNHTMIFQYSDSVRDSLLCSAPLYPPCSGHVILQTCALRFLCAVCVKAESLFCDSPLLPSRC